MNKIRLSVDDGCASDMRVADLCRKYNIEAIFYIPVEWHSLAYDKGYEPLTYTDALDIELDFEIGCHTVTHRHLTKLDTREAEQEILESKAMMERLFQINKITKFCAPRGYMNPELDVIVNECFESQRLTKGPGLVHIHPNSGANDNKPWRDCIDDKTTECWMHSWELDKFNLWDELEAFLETISS